MGLPFLNVDIRQTNEKMFISPPIIKQGTFNITLEDRVVGNVDISRYAEETYVSVKVEDMFLTIEQMTILMSNLKREFGLSNHQRISFQQA